VRLPAQPLERFTAPGADQHNYSRWFMPLPDVGCSCQRLDVRRIIIRRIVVYMISVHLLGWNSAKPD